MDTRWSSTTKLLVIITLLVAVIWLIGLFSQGITALLIGAILAYLLKPATDWIVRRTGWPRGFAVVMLGIAVIAFLSMIPLLATPSVLDLIASFDVDIAGVINLLNSIEVDSINLGPFVLDFNEFSQQVVEGLRNLITPFASGAIQVVSGVASSVLWMIFVLVVVFWLLKDSYKLSSWVTERIPSSYRGEVNQILNEIGHIWGGFFRGELVLAVTVGLLAGVSMWILGLRNVVLLAIIAGLMEFIPTIGPIIAAIAAIIIAWFTGSRWLPPQSFLLVTIVTLVYLVIFQSEQLYLLPRIVGRRVRLHPGVVFVGTILGATQFGVLGVLLAAPVMATMMLLGSYTYRKLLDLEPFATLPGMEASVEWRGMIKGQPISGILFDLDGTIIDSDDHTVEKLADRLGPLQRIFPAGDARPFVRHWLLLMEGPINWLLSQLDRVSLDDEAIRLSRWFRQGLGFHRPDDMRLIQGVDGTIRELQQTYQLAIVTTRGRASTEHFLQLAGLDDAFSVVITSDDVDRLKPHPAPLWFAAEKLGLEIDHCVMVGDTSADILAARAAGASSIGVLCGFGSQGELDEADIVVDSTTDLTRWL